MINKYVCLKSDGCYIFGNIYEVEITYFWIGKRCVKALKIDGCIPINLGLEDFIPLAEWRDKRINQILDEEN